MDLLLYFPGIIGVLFIIYISQVFDKKFNILTPITMIVFSFLYYYFIHSQIIHLDSRGEFAAVLFALLPLMLIGDGLSLKTKDLKKHMFNLVFIAGIAVALSIAIGVAVTGPLFAEYNLRTVDIIILFAMVLPTDPVSVISTIASARSGTLTSVVPQLNSTLALTP